MKRDRLVVVGCAVMVLVGLLLVEYGHEIARGLLYGGFMVVAYRMLRHRYFPQRARRGRTLLELVAAAVAAVWAERKARRLLGDAVAGGAELQIHVHKTRRDDPVAAVARSLRP